MRDPSRCGWDTKGSLQVVIHLIVYPNHLQDVTQKKKKGCGFQLAVSHVESNQEIPNTLSLVEFDSLTILTNLETNEIMSWTHVRHREPIVHNVFDHKNC